MRRTIVFVTVMLIGIGVCFAQVQFARFIGGDESESAKSVIQTIDGGYAMVGKTKSYGEGTPDSTNLFVVKLSSTLTHEWSRAIGGTGLDEGWSIIQTSDSGYVITGVTSSYGSGSDDIILIKLSSSGTMEWARAIGGSSLDDAYSVVQTFDSGYAITGNIAEGGVDFSLIKLTSTGALDWVRDIGGAQSDIAQSVIQTSDSGYAITGRTYSYGGGNDDIYVVKLSPTGLLEWSRAIGGTGFEEGWSIIQTNDSGYAILGYTESYGAGNSDLFFVKISPTGTHEWSRTIGGTKSDEGKSLIQIADSGYVLAGHTYNYGLGSTDFFLVKISSTGVFEWSHAIGAGSSEDRCRAVIITSDNGYAMAGYGWHDGTDFFLVKCDSTGSSCTGMSATPTVSDVSPGYVNPSPSVYSPTPTVETITPTVTNVTPTITEVCTEMGITGIEITPDKLYLDISPNPFNSTVEIRVSGIGTRVSSIEIYDINGRMVCAPSPSVPLPAGEEGKTLLPPGEGGSKSRMRAFIWQPDKSISSGVYLVRVTTEDKSVEKKVVYLK